MKGRRRVDYALEGILEATTYDGRKLSPGMRFAGPAIIEDPGSVAVVHAENLVEIDAFGNIVITLEE